MLIVLALWLACAVVGGLIFQSKNRSAATGTIVGLLFGPVGVIVLTMFEKRSEAAAAAAPPASGPIGSLIRRLR
jgi:cyanate permease